MAEPGPSSLRQPKLIFNSRNGFLHQVESRMSGTAPSKINLHAVAANPKGASREELSEFRDAVHRRQIVEDMMELKGIYFPGLDAIRQANETPETSETIKGRIQDLQKKHLEEVRTLYKWHAEDYHDEMLDMSRSKADHEESGVGAFYRTSRSCHDLVTSFDDELDRHHYAYLTTLNQLQLDRKAASQREADEQKLRDQQFPANVEAYHRLRKDIKLRIANFLSADEYTQERIRSEFSWSYPQVRDLLMEYKHNENFKEEVQQLLRNVEARDPRKMRQ